MGLANFRRPRQAQRRGCWLAFTIGLAFGTSVPTELIAIEPSRASDLAPPEEVADSIRRGWDVLIRQALLPSDFDQETIDNLWGSWPNPLHLEAEAEDLPQRRLATFARYGLTPRPQHQVRVDPHSGDVVSTFAPPSSLPDGDPGPPLQYVVSESGEWTMNCFACHGGSVYGTPTPGAPNNRFALQTLTDEIRSTKFRIGKPLGRMELGSLLVPLGTTNGTTNAVVFGMGLMHYRDEQLNFVEKMPAKFTSHDMDAPPWWHFHKRPYLYIDGFAQKGHRGLMQFTLVPENDASFYRRREDDFRDVFAFLSSLRPPSFTGEIDPGLAQRGSPLFNDHCARCHGTYGDQAAYPNQMVDIHDVGTDPVRLEALSVQGRQKYGRSWFAHAGEEGEQDTRPEPIGYVAPPLDGVWASPPYFHNGSVPTLWDVLHPKERPTVWYPTTEAMDPQKIGLTVQSVDKVPLMNPDVAVRRGHFDTRRFGKSNAGHDYPDDLTEPEKEAVLEYLKTL
ncbi:MAG: hypothetical protein AAF670_14215 [Planctomycetota bacterium]